MIVREEEKWFGKGRNEIKKKANHKKKLKKKVFYSTIFRLCAVKCVEFQPKKTLEQQKSFFFSNYSIVPDYVASTQYSAIQSPVVSLLILDFHLIFFCCFFCFYFRFFNHIIFQFIHIIMIIILAPIFNQ